MTPDTVVWIASMTKALTATAAMQLVEQGKLDLDSPATRWVPDLAGSEVLVGWDENGQPRTRAPKRAITLRHLLTHTAGFAYEIWNSDCAHYQQAKGIPGIGSCKNAALRTPLLFDPGERWEYGINIDWAGKMVEAVSGKPLGVYLQENLFEPARDGQHRVQDHPGDARAPGQGPSARRRRQVHSRSISRSTQDPEFEMGGGGLYSTAGDYLHVRAHDPESRQRQRQPRAQARDRGPDVAQRDGRPEGDDAEDRNPAACRTTPSSSPACRRAGA